MKYIKPFTLDRLSDVMPALLRTFNLRALSIIFQYIAGLTIILSLGFLNACSTKQPVERITVTQTDQTRQVVTELSPPAAAEIDERIYIDATQALRQDELEKAESLFKEFINNNPNLSGAYVNLALIQFKKGNFDASLELIQKALKLNPQQAQAYQLRGQLSIQNGKINDAKQDLLKAIEINPGYSNAQYNLALLYDIYLQDIKLAIQHYEIYMTLIDKPDATTREWIEHLKGSLKNG